jgi:hypothetical protein
MDCPGLEVAAERAAELGRTVDALRVPVIALDTCSRGLTLGRASEALASTLSVELGNTGGRA